MTDTTQAAAAHNAPYASEAGPTDKFVMLPSGLTLAVSKVTPAMVEALTHPHDAIALAQWANNAGLHSPHPGFRAAMSRLIDRTLSRAGKLLSA